MKTLVKMKSTQMGKDDDTAITIKYNEGGEYRIGPDLLKAFKNLNAVTVLDEKKQDSDKKVEKDDHKKEEEVEESSKIEEEVPNKKKKKSK